MAEEPTAVLLRQLHHLAHARDESAGDRELLDRFVAQRDQDAFAALVRRHGSLVLGVCRAILGPHHDAETAFQATFLTLAHKASGIRQPEALAGWLHAVAGRLVRK